MWHCLFAFRLLAVLFLATAASGCGFNNWRQSQRIPRLNPSPEPISIERYSVASPTQAPPGVQKAIDQIGKENQNPPPNRVKAVSYEPLGEVVPATLMPIAQTISRQPEKSPPPALFAGLLDFGRRLDDRDAAGSWGLLDFPSPNVGLERLPPIKPLDVGNASKPVSPEAQVKKAPTIADSAVKPAVDDAPAEDNLQRNAAIGPRKVMTLAEARSAALVGNLDLRVVYHNPDIARQQVRQEAWKFESTFQGSVNRDVLTPPPSILGIPSIYDNLFGIGLPVQTNSFGPSFKTPFTTGGSMTIGEAVTSRYYNVGAPVPTFYDFAPTLNLTQPILRGAGVYVNTAPIVNAELQLGRVDAQTKLIAISVLAQTEQAYWVLFGSQKVLEIAMQQVELAAEQVRLARRLVDAGVVSQVDVLRSLSGMQLRQQAVVSARLQVKLNNRQLKQIMQASGLQVDTPIEIVAGSAPNLLGLSFDREALGRKSIGNRLELVDLALQYKQNQLAANVAKNQALPQIDFVFQGQLLGYGTSSSDSVNSAYSTNYSQLFAGINFSQGLALNQTARANYQAASIAASRTAAQQSLTRIAIVKQVNDAVDQFEQNWNRILVANEAVSASQKTYEAERRLFELGQRTGDLVLIAASNLATAQQQLIQAVVDFQISRVQIAVATGTILGYAQLEALPDAAKESSTGPNDGASNTLPPPGPVLQPPGELFPAPPLGK
jgi:outer membrane protein TolC